MYKFLKSQYRKAWLRAAGISEVGGLTTLPMGGSHGWPVWPDALHPQSVVYSYGVGNDVAWDLDMIARFGVTVQAFDPTPESIEWVASQSLPPQFRFHDCGLAAFDGELKFYPPKKPGRMHFTEERLRYHKADVQPVVGRVERLSTTARRLGHTHIDVLKMDIEGSEFAALPDMLVSGLTVDQLLIELHYHYPSHSIAEGARVLHQLQRAGFVCHFISDRVLEFSLIHERLLKRPVAAAA